MLQVEVLSTKGQQKHTANSTWSSTHTTLTFLDSQLKQMTFFLLCTCSTLSMWKRLSGQSRSWRPPESPWLQLCASDPRATWTGSTLESALSDSSKPVRKSPELLKPHHVVVKCLEGKDRGDPESATEGKQLRKLWNATKTTTIPPKKLILTFLKKALFSIYIFLTLRF